MTKTDEYGRRKAYFPSFYEVHDKLYGDESPHVLLNYSNPYDLSPNFDRFPHSNLSPDFFIDTIVTTLGRVPNFVVEVGSFQGHSAVTLARSLDSLTNTDHLGIYRESEIDGINGDGMFDDENSTERDGGEQADNSEEGEKSNAEQKIDENGILSSSKNKFRPEPPSDHVLSVPVLCIDPWVGDTNIWANRASDPSVQYWASRVQDGRSLLFDQYMANVQSAIVDQKLASPFHIIPLHATSTVGARFLDQMSWSPDVIFLDSAHEEGETLLELELYYSVLAPGGVLFGDDYTWHGVRKDLMKFMEIHNYGKDPNDMFTFRLERADPNNKYSVLLWVLQKAKYY